MKRVLKWIGIGLAGLVVLVVVAAIGLFLVGGSRLSKTHDDITAENLTIPGDPESLARGEHLVNVACRDCHGSDLTGTALIDEQPIGTVYAANITGLAETHSDADIIRAIRHGLDTDGRQLIIMPAEVFNHFSAEDLGSIIAYLKTVPRTGDERPKPDLAFVGRIMLGAGLFGDAFPAEYIDHEMPFPTMPDISANVEYGKYLATFCASCHGTELAGGQPADPDAPPAPNLTPGGRLGGWDEVGFMQTIRTGTTPEGRELNPDFMPWKSFAKFEDEELMAIWLYLQTVPDPQTGLAQETSNGS
jgi:mono/diheme cytochrome c family protein